MVKNIEPGPFVDKLIAQYLNLSRKKYSTNAASALVLLSKFVGETPSGFNIEFKKQINMQYCKVTLNRQNQDYEAVDGYLPMAICLLFINSWAKPLKLYSYEFLEMRYEHYLEAKEKEDKGEFLTEDDEEVLSTLHYDIPELMKNLSEDQVRALVKYANR
jgi:hypothetical protein